jgi:hypothetical protein
VQRAGRPGRSFHARKIIVYATHSAGHFVGRFAGTKVAPGTKTFPWTRLPEFPDDATPRRRQPLVQPEVLESMPIPTLGRRRAAIAPHGARFVPRRALAFGVLAAAGGLAPAGCDSILGAHFDLRPPAATSEAGESGADAETADASADSPADDAEATDAADALTAVDADAAGSPSDASADADAPDGCPPAATAPDLYVDPSSQDACAFRTITLALAVARTLSLPAGRTIHVAPGTYSAASGEQFPLDLHGGLSLAGAGASGANPTVIEGAGIVAVSPPKNAHTSLSKATNVSALLLVGHATTITRISGLALNPPAGLAADGLEAIVCDRGNAGPNPQQPTTIVDKVVVEKFEVGVRATWSSSPSLSGCNALVTGSTVRDGMYGVVADGDNVVDASLHPLQLVAVTLGGDGVSDANAFLNLAVRDGNNPGNYGGSGLIVSDAVCNVVVKGNRFAQEAGRLSDTGIWAVQGASYCEGPGMDVEKNEFGPLSSSGMTLWGFVSVDRLIGNNFHDISTIDGTQWLGTALNVDTQFVSPRAAARLSRVRNNVFFGNDVGVGFAIYSTNLDPSTPYDFGTASDPGGNTFRCNAVTGPRPEGTGGDVILGWGQPQDPPMTIPMVGNTWDHAPPTTWVSAVGPGTIGPPLGTDVAMTGSVISDAGTAPLIGAGTDVAGASSSDTPPCPPGRKASGPRGPAVR